MGAAESLRPEDSLWNLISVYLRKERRQRELSQAEVGVVIQADKQRVANIEAGRLNLTSVQAELLDEAWGTLFVALRHYAVVLGRDREWTKQLIDFETGALIIKIYNSQIVPVPFQTEDYARAIITSCGVLEDVESAVRKRMDRQKLLLDQLKGMSLWLLIDEAALRYEGVPREVMTGQLERLIELAERASVRIVPSGSPAHIGVDGDFELITTADGTDIAYVWAQLQGRLVPDASEVRRMSLRYDRIGAQALPEQGSLELIKKVMEHLGDH
ncbi:MULTISPECIES: DUF5753 domain-containing protein [Actinomadura]|uniref:DUF5753 domain-containing protein n=1 Tax=Actinomadura yumaensis TaxID=111807 RepID=A0ABW2CEI1_9ACTN|nr:DUF5753 domain-containing protein [Actinomadura sp. J1-007]MWK34519.1 hypothetical protein [Actinomadura sp. J1-007]